MSNVEPGKTYLGVVCQKCKKSAPFVEIKEGTTLGKTAGEFDIECPWCGHKAAYPAHELRTMEVHRKH